ncbi:MAG: LLM class flavin-dependent oxidoreductase [Gammaproteobacteria bacterium]
MSNEKITFATNLRSERDIEQAAQLAEQQGFDVLGVGEHVSFYGNTANGIVSLSVAAGATEKIRLMSAITLVPLYPPALLAKMGAALDVASNGRFMLGVGVGGEFPNEFEACGIPVAERGARTDDALEVISRTWSDTNVTYHGKFTTLNNFSLKPLPVQKPRPPIWISGRKKVAMRRAAQYGDGWLPYMYTPEQLAESISNIEQYAHSFDRDPTEITSGLYIFSCIHEDGDLAIKMATERLSEQYSQDFSKIIHKYALAGDPEQCRQRLQEYVDAGARFVMLSSACSDEYLEENQRMLAQSLLPSFR